MKPLKLTVAAVAVAAALGGAYSFGHLQAIPDAHATPAASVATTTVPPVTVAPAALPDMRSIVAANAPAVVNISVTGTRKTTNGPQIDPDDPFYQFFRRFGGRLPQGATPVQGQGSGFIVSADGTILTAGDYAEVTVADTGCGIPPEIIRRVTEPFFTTRRGQGGTGLGHSISHKIAREHGGSLELVPNHGPGVTAVVALPLAGLRQEGLP